MSVNVISQLEELHFSASEAKVYAALAELGQSPAGPIIKKTGLHRSVVYESLDKLVARKLVFELEKKKIATFQLTDPERLVTETTRQQRIAKDLVPILKELSSTALPEITVYEGVDSYRRFWLESTATLPVGTTDYVAGSIGDQWFEYLGPTAAKQYLKLRIKRRIKWKLLVFDKADIELELLKKYPKLHEYRLIKRPNPRYGNFNIFENHSLVLHSATEPMIIEVKSTSLVNVFQNIFDILWETGKPITAR